MLFPLNPIRLSSLDNRPFKQLASLNVRTTYAPEVGDKELQGLLMIMYSILSAGTGIPYK